VSRALVLLAACSSPAGTPPWLRGLVTDAVAQLAQSPRYLDTERAAARAYLEGQLAQQGWQAMEQAYPTGANVYAVLPGAHAQQIVIGAHFDTVSGSPGADDNASGCAVVLAAARYLAGVKRGPTFVIAFFDQEEEGLFGSRAFAQMLAGTDVVAVHTIDQAGWDADGDRRFELELPTPGLEQAYRSAGAALGAPLTTTTTAGTDHQAFREAGFAAVGLTEGYVESDTTPYRHTAQDTADTVDDDYLVLAGELVGRVVTAEAQMQ
jgi:hypothetical protein